MIPITQYTDDMARCCVLTLILRLLVHAKLPSAHQILSWIAQETVFGLRILFPKLWFLLLLLLLLAELCSTAAHDGSALHAFDGAPGNSAAGR